MRFLLSLLSRVTASPLQQWPRFGGTSALFSLGTFCPVPWEFSSPGTRSNCKTNVMPPQECSHLSSLLAMLPVLSWLLARSISSHSPTPVDIPRRTYRLELKICSPLPAAGNASGLGQEYRTPELLSRVPKPTFSRSLGQLRRAHRSLAAPPFLGHAAEEVPAATTWQPEKSVLAGGSVAG